MNNEEVDLLIIKYLRERGYEHSAFTFMHEAETETAERKWGDQVPRNALLRHLYRALLFQTVEQNRKDPAEHVAESRLI